jgi:hypothetical protein
MDRARLPQFALAAMLLLIIFGVGLIQAVSEVAGRSQPQLLDILRQAPTASALRTYEHELEQNSWCGQRIRRMTQYAQFMALGDLGPKALRGRDGWLFYRPGLQYLLSPCGEVADAASAIVEFRDALAARGIKLLMIPAPEKPSVYPARLTSLAQVSSTPLNTHTTRLMEQLRGRGVECVDLFAAFAAAAAREKLYLEQDSHWTPIGMKIAAETTAARLIELGWLEKGKMNYLARPVQVSRHGDVLQMVQNPAIAALFEPETIACEQIFDESGAPLEGTADSEVLVLGDSFLRIYERDEPRSAGFVSHLARELHMPIASIINDGGASTLVRQELYRKPELLKGKKVVVWEFVERDIRFGTEGWQHVPLPAQ